LGAAHQGASEGIVRAGRPDRRGLELIGSSGGRALLLEAFLVRPFDVEGPAKPFESLDEPGVDVDLSLEYAVARAGGVGVVKVVPGLALTQDGQPPDVPRPVAGREGFTPVT
jgi:hypothetical protein